MLLALRETARDEQIVTLEGLVPPLDAAADMCYQTRTGAIVAIDGVVCGAFDREHSRVLLAASPRERRIELRVERRSLPTHGLPPGDGIRWRVLLARASAEPSLACFLEPPERIAEQTGSGGIALWGHSHLDVAWLWPYSQARRKAVRTFANALDLMRRDAAFIFMQSQPQLYAFVEEDAPELFAAVQQAVGRETFDPAVAAMWVEPDCNLASGESIVRQLLHAYGYCMSRFGSAPSIAWLPDTFGFPNTLPSLLAHAGVARFATTKLFWNDTSPFAHAQFAWIGPDGARVTAALIAGMDGRLTERRVQTARKRGEPVVVGYGDGGGGPVIADVQDARTLGTWQRPQSFFEALEQRELPQWRDELYLQYHRGTYTTHHDIKALNARCERDLLELEEGLAWAHAVRAQPEMLDRLNAIAQKSWEIVLRNQFHDVLPGTATSEAFAEVRADYDRAREGIAVLRKALHAMLPRPAQRATRGDRRVTPLRDGDEWVLRADGVEVRLSASGAITALQIAGEASCVTQGNLLALYADRPKRWDAWNIDATYRKRRLGLRPAAAYVEDDALCIAFATRASSLVMRVFMERDALLRVELTGDWHEKHALLRVEHWLPVEARAIRYGTPHGHIDRGFDDPSQFEVPGQRYAAAAGQDERGVAVLTRDTYGWNARRLPRGGVALGHSLLRSPVWPDATADRGAVNVGWAYAPLQTARPSHLEALWDAYAMPPRVRLFISESPGVLVVAVKPAHDGDGVIVRVRECDGERRPVILRCGARMRSVSGANALERAVESTAEIRGERLHDTIAAFGLRTYRVRFAGK